MKPSQFKDFLKKRVNDLLKEYIAEAEHQDGNGYWSNFHSVMEGVKDFALYISEGDFTEEEEEQTEVDEKEKLNKIFLVKYTIDGLPMEVEIKTLTPAHVRALFPREYGNHPITSITEKGS